MKNLIQAVINVGKKIPGLEKDKLVGTGSSSYKGVSDESVKKLIGKLMQEEGLAIFPVAIDPAIRIDRWEESGGQYGPKQKQMVFTDVKTTYRLYHTSGESIDICGYGHGTDSQDKSAGKATTYALKYMLLYLFMVPTGKIDDADNDHSETIPTPVKAVAPAPAPKPKPVLEPGHPKWAPAIAALAADKTTIQAIEKQYTVTDASKKLLVEQAAGLK